MDRSIDNYLHKKFKKQLSVEPKIQQNDKENKSSLRSLEQGEEKTTPDNNKLNNVPNQSTNNQNNNSLVPVVSASESKSSISIIISESGNSKPCISEEGNRCSFDNTTLYNSTKIITNSPSSNVNDYSYYNQTEREPTSPLQEDIDKSIESQPTPEKNPNSGKYVCNYCNLVCSKPSVLQKHIRAHTNERPYPCTSCGFSFKTRSNLYKHCRSRTHANRVMGVKAQENPGEADVVKQNYTDNATQTQTYANNDEALESSSNKNKPYKPRFHQIEPPEDDRNFSGTDLSHHINEIINKNNSIVNSNDSNLLKRRFSEVDNANNNEYRIQYSPTYNNVDNEPLNLTNKNRKRCMSEATEPVMQKSLIKELLLKNLYSDMQCPYCKMIFQTVTELELHKLRSCKGKPSEVKYSRSSSVNVASILTKNKNAFDSMPHFQNSIFPLNSPGPFLGKTRLVDSDKSKSFSFDAVNLPSPEISSPNYVLSPFKEEKKMPIKLFGGEVKIHNSSGESKSYRIEKDDKQSSENNYNEYDEKLSENRVVKSSLQSGGTVLTNKTSKEEPRVYRDVIRVYENTSVSPNIDMANFGKPHFNFDSRMNDEYSSSRNTHSMEQSSVNNISEPKYPNIADFSQNAVKLLTPNLKHPTIQISGMLPQTNLIYTSTTSTMSLLSSPKPKLTDSQNISIDSEYNDVRSPFQPVKRSVIQKPADNIYNPMNLLVNGKVIRYVPGIPGPVVAEEPAYPATNIVIRPRTSPSSKANVDSRASPVIIQKPITPIVEHKQPLVVITKASETSDKIKEPKPPESTLSEPKKFIRPNSLALKPTTASLKQHHGLTPTIFNQILISPDTPRVAKKYAQHLFNGNYFSYLGLKCSTKPVYCTLNKTQPFYVPHFKKLSMYSEWRQQDTKVDKLYVSSYDSRQRNQRFTTAGKTAANSILHSSYKFVVSELPSKNEKEEESQKTGLIGGYEAIEDSPYIRGRGRGRYVCEQCGIRCKKPSMLKKHIRTHSNDRPYTCNHCNFSFKTKGNLTKHMKSKSHSKNSTATSSGSGSSTHLSLSQSSESDTDDSGMDSSDESMTRQQEHEAAYGLLSLSQKTTVAASSTEILSPSGIIRTGSPASTSDQFMTTEEIAYVSKTNYAKNKILDNLNYKPNKIVGNITPEEEEDKEVESMATYLGKTSTTRPLTYPYTSVITSPENIQTPLVEELSEPKSIKQFHVIQKYAKTALERKQPSTEKIERNNSVPYLPSPVPTLKINDVVVQDSVVERKRKITVIENNFKNKVHRNDEVMDLSIATSEKREKPNHVARFPEEIPYPYENHRINEEIYNNDVGAVDYRRSPESFTSDDIQVLSLNNRNLEMTRKTINNPQQGPVLLLNPINPEYNNVSEDMETHSNSSNDTRLLEYDNSAMETLADVATKQVKLDKNTLAKSVASEYLKLATQNENLDGSRDNFIPTKEIMNDLMVKSEGNKSCTICSKSFNKPFQLRLHMNIHYLERPFRCDSCSVSFRTKGHLQKHERSASHYSKLSSSPAQSSTEPRPFKCSDCNIAFRIHGHLAKHLRSKMHIMKLECLAKIPFGLYAELERSNSLLTEINTSDGDQCLESLKTLAKKVFINDPGKLHTIHDEVDPGSHIDPDS